MKAFVTGASGFIGNRVARKLIERGYDTWLLARSPEKLADLVALGAHLAPGDINDVNSMREAMRGSDVVFHIAGWYKIGTREPGQGWHTNVDGTAHVLALAHELGVRRIVYTSTVAVFGDTHGRLVDEHYHNPGGEFPTEYDRTKWIAHYKVALPLIERGAPIIIVMPGGVFGPGDNSLVGDSLRLFYRGLLPILPGPDTQWTYAYVDDVAEGHILAAERGRPGECYILAGPALSLSEIADLWAKTSGKPAPRLRIPSRFLRPSAPLLDAIGSLIPLPALLSGEAARDVGFSYLASSDKARRELGWSTRPVEEGLRDTFAWLAESEPEPPAGHKQWTLRLLADKMVELAYIDGISHETVRQVLKKRNQTLAERRMVHSARSQRRVCVPFCVPYGRCAGSVHLALRPALPAGVLRRDQQATDR